SDLVVRGSFGDVLKIYPKLKRGGNSIDVTVKVQETIKGKAIRELTLRLYLETQKDLPKSEMLLFLSEYLIEGSANYFGVLRNGAIDPSRDSLVSLDFNVVYGREEILQSVRDASASLPNDKVPAFIFLEPPRSTAAHQKGLATQVLRVPVVSRLEVLG